MKYAYSDWNQRHGTIPIFWKPEHYIDAGWYRHPDKTHGFSTEDANYKIYGDNLGVYIPEKLDPIFEKAFNFFDLNELVFSLSMYKTGMILPWHKDNYPTYSKNKKVADPETVVRIMVFLEDAQPGHQLWIEDKMCSGKAGSWFSWQGRAKHMAANLGEQNRYVLQITGICQEINRPTESIFCP
jgi:hypothetical protein